MQLVILSKMPNKLTELSERMMENKLPKGSDPYIKRHFSTQEVRQLGVEFFASMLKVLSNKGNWEIVRKIEECDKASLKDTHNLQLNLVRLYEHGLTISSEKKSNSLTELGKKVLSSSLNLSVYLDEARRGEQNLVLLQLLISREEKSFSELNRELALNVGSLYRHLENLVDLGFVLKSIDDKKYRINTVAPLEFLREFCMEIIEKYQKMGLYFQKGELWANNVPEEPTLLPATHDLEYFAVEDVINDHIIVTYSYESRKKKEELLKLIIYEQTRWKDDICKPVQSDQIGRIRIAYKIDNIASLQQFFNFFCLHAIRVFDRLLVEEIDVPRSLWKRFESLKPRYGIDGIRQLLGIVNRPLLHFIIPPYLKKKEEVADIIRHLLEAGVDAVGDHQFIGLQLTEFRERVENIVVAIENFSQEFSNKTLFYPYIEGESFLEKIDVIKDTKCKYLGLGLSPLSFGIPTTMFMRKNYLFPLHFHLTLYGIYTRIGQSGYSAKEGFKAGHGISSNVILKLFALCGGDEVNVDYHGLYSIDPTEVANQCEILRRFNVFPALVGGINLSNLRDIIHNYGTDIILKIDGGKFLPFLGQGRMKEFVGAYQRLIENATKGRIEDDERIMKWKEKEKGIENEFIIS